MQNEKSHKGGKEPTVIRVRSEGLKLDLMLRQDKVSGFTIDYHDPSKVAELQRWIKIIDHMIPEPGPPQKRSGGEIETAPQQAPEVVSVKEEETSAELQAEQPEFATPEALTPEVEAPEVKPPEVEVPEPAVPAVAVPEVTAPEVVAVREEEPTQEEQGKPLEEPEISEDLVMSKPDEPASNPTQREAYREIVLEAVDVSLNSLGRDGKHAILSLLENRYDLRDQDIPDHPADFVVLLQEILGSSAKTLEREIILHIRSVVDAPGDTLEAVIKSLKERGPIRRKAQTSLRDSLFGPAGFRYDATYYRRSH